MDSPFNDPVNSTHCTLGVLTKLSIQIFVAILCSVSTTVFADDDRPNVVVLLADDLGWKDIGCYGGPVKTPALDRLASGGMRLTNFYSGAPVCSTARATLMTGRHHLRTGVYTVIQDHMHDMHLLESETTIAEVLKGSGYDTVHLGKWHLGTPFRGRKKPWIDEHGFDYWFATDLNASPSHRDPVNFWRNRKRVGPLKGYACQLVVDEAIDWLDNVRDSSNPFFLNIWFHEPHAKLAAPENIVKKYGKIGDQAALYSATIDNTDQAISRLLKKLKQDGELENTLIIYMSDHGSYRHERNGGLKAGKGSLFDGGIRSPGIVYWPKKIKPAQVNDIPAGAIDILPTICGLAGIEKPGDVLLDGVDLSPMMTGKDPSFRRPKPLSWHSPCSQPIVAIRDGNYSLVGFRGKEYPKEKDAIKKVMDQMHVILKKKLGRELSPTELWHQCYNSPISSPEWNRLRSKFVTLNTFQEKWTSLIKSGYGGISRYELYDLSKDPGQKKNIAKQSPEIENRLKKVALQMHSSVLKESPIWGESQSDDVRIHRLKSEKRSRFDAFAYVNRIPLTRDNEETADDLSGRILGRLANQEGRVQIKLPPGMSRLAYDGFKIALESGKGLHFGNCFQCHHLPELAGQLKKDRIQKDRIQKDQKQKGQKQKGQTPSLRNGKLSIEQLSKVLANENHRDIRLDQADVKRVFAFLNTLTDVSDSEFRNLIIKSTVLDSTGENK